MIRVESPALLLNGVSYREYTMDATWAITIDDRCAPLSRTVAYVARRAPWDSPDPDWPHRVKLLPRRPQTTTRGRLRSLVINCHGKPGRLTLCEGVDARHLPLFLEWRGLVDKIWLTSCEIAHGAAGDFFCSNLARQVQCYVVAPTELQCNEQYTTLPDNHLQTFEGLLLCYDPAGRLSWSHRYPSTWDERIGGVKVCHSNPDD